MWQCNNDGSCGLWLIVLWPSLWSTLCIKQCKCKCSKYSSKAMYSNTITAFPLLSVPAICYLPPSGEEGHCWWRRPDLGWLAGTISDQIRMLSCITSTPRPRASRHAEKLNTCTTATVATHIQYLEISLPRPHAGNILESVCMEGAQFKINVNAWWRGNVSLSTEQFSSTEFIFYWMIPTARAGEHITKQEEKPEVPVNVFSGY